MVDSTLAAIRTKVRRLVRAPSPAQITDAQIDEYVNTFMLYDLPAHLQLEDLRNQLTWYTIKGKDTYITQDILMGAFNTGNWNDACIASEKPMYIAGMPVFITQSPEQFYNLFPFTYITEDTGFTGDGITQDYVFTLKQLPILKGTENSFIVSNLQNQGPGKVVFTAGSLSAHSITNRYPHQIDGEASGTIDYDTGIVNIHWDDSPILGAKIIVKYVPTTLSRPQSILFFANQFILRPVPDDAYPVVVEVRLQPAALLDTTDAPQIKQWWQYIAYGAAKKIFEDRVDPESVQQIMPEFKQQEALVLRRSLLYQANERSATIYTEQTGIGAGGFSSFGGPF
jgi:hypothetical protein